MNILFDHTDIGLYEDNLTAMTPPWCEFQIGGLCPCVAICHLTEEWADCCGCERCCICGM